MTGTNIRKKGLFNLALQSCVTRGRVKQITHVIIQQTMMQ